MKIIHCSDLHLDSALSSNLPTEKAKERNAELCAAFGRMVDFAEHRQVSAVLIAGDLFDSSYVSAAVRDYVLQQIRRTAGVTFFCLRGNHDEGSDTFRGQQLPANLVTFGPRWESHRCGDVVITAMEPDDAGWHEMYSRLRLKEEDVNIVMLHGQISAQSGAEQIALPLLRGKHIRYLALGHLHRYQKEQLDPDGEYCYSGCPEGRGFDECGEKGFSLLEVNGGMLRSCFVPFAKRILHEVAVDISGAETVTQIISRMEQAAAGIGPEDLVKFILRGTYTLQTHKDIAFARKMMEPKFWFVKIKDESTLYIDRESYLYDASLKGEFLRLVLASERTDAEKERIITCGIRALSGEEVAL